MRQFFIIFFLTASLFAQYTKNDFNLVKTTAEREFNREIILSYLHSGKEQKIIAGLLSASHSGDTSFVNEIEKLNFGKYAEHICFALGQIGCSPSAAAYLYNIFISGRYPEHSHFLYDALGKLANEETSQNVLSAALENEKYSRDGISIFIFNLFYRKISFDKSAVKDILIDELKNKEGMRKLEALFVIARLGGLKESEALLTSIITSKDKINSSQVKSYAVSCFTRQRYFPNNKKLFNQALTHKDWRVRIQAAKAVSYFNFSSKAQINSYFKLILDGNCNVARQAAISIRNLKTGDKLSSYIKNQIEQYFQNKKLNQITKGELFISYCSMNRKNTPSLIKKYDKLINDKYIFEVLQDTAVSARYAYSFLIKKINKNEKILLELLPAFLTLQNRLKNNSEYEKELLDLLNSNHASVASTVADGLDSAFAVSHSQKIEKIIIPALKKHLNDASYYETLLSLANLGGKINPAFKGECLKILKESKQYSILNYVNLASGNGSKPSKDFKNLETLWKNSFAYSQAKVTTNKGEFTIKFYPGYAPISVGNFVHLAKKGFYDGVIFHRVVPDFVAQTGDSTGTGFGGPGYDIVSEFSTLPFNTNYVGMASAGKDTEGSQWYVMHNIALHLYGRYSTFGKVISGVKTIPLINQGDKILGIKLIK